MIVRCVCLVSTRPKKKATNEKKQQTNENKKGVRNGQ